MTLLNPMQAFADQLPPGWDLAGDVLVGSHSPRVALLSVIGAVSMYNVPASHSLNGAQQLT